MSERELGVYLGHHQYFGVDYVVVWQIAVSECPLYRTAIAALPEYKRLDSES